MMISGFTSAQSLISNAERDSIVAKIIRGAECAEKLILSNDVIKKGDKIILDQTNVIKSQEVLIKKYDSVVLGYEENEIDYENIIANEKEISKKHKRKPFSWLIKGVAIGVVGGVLIR